MRRLDRLPPRTRDGRLLVVVEAPRGSQVKLKFEPDLGAITIGRPLPLGVHYPFDWGFVPSTCAPDGDPLDAMVLNDVPTHPGIVIPCAPIGLVKVSQRKRSGRGRERNDRVLAVPLDAPRFDDLRDARQLPARTRAEIERFFLTAVYFAKKEAQILGWTGPREAERAIAKAIREAERPAQSSSSSSRARPRRGKG